MPIRKIESEDWGQKACLHPEHSFPSHISLPAGTYEHECPACGAKRQAVVPLVTC